MSDWDLLRQYVQDTSQEAFAQLVRRHLAMVYATARRAVGDGHLAEDISQAVFLVLARKAATLRPPLALAGWLFRVTCFAAASAQAKEQRRKHHEQQAGQARPAMEAEQIDQVWHEVEPKLNAALNQLAAKDRNAIVLRYLEEQTMAEVAATLGVSEAAAKMRIGRAMERLRGLLGGKAGALSASGLATVLAARVVEAAPGHLAGAVTGTAAGGAGATGSALAIAKGTVQLMAWANLKMAAGVAVLVLVVLGTAVGVGQAVRSGGNPPVPVPLSKQSGTSAEQAATLSNEVALQSNRLKRDGDRVWIAGLENAVWGNATDRQNSVIAAAEAALRAMGEEVDYQRLMGLGGAAFRIQHAWCPSSPHAMCGTNTIDPALAAVGYRLRWLDILRDGKEVPGATDEARATVVASIDRGVPLLWSGKECGLIVGYVNIGQKLLIRPYSPRKPGYVETDQWAWGVGVIERLPAVPSQKESILSSLKLAVTMMRTEKVDVYHSGFAAYEAWAKDLEAGLCAIPPAWEVAPIAELDKDKAFSAMLANGYTYGCLSNAREMAEKYLRWTAPQFDAATAAHLTKAADLYQKMHQTMWAQRDDLPQPWNLMPWDLKPDRWTPAMRHAQAKVLRELLPLEKQAIGELEQALAAQEQGNTQK